MVGLSGQFKKLKKNLVNRYNQWCDECEERAWEEEQFIRMYKYDPNFPKPKPRKEKINTELFLEDVLYDKKKRF